MAAPLPAIRANTPPTALSPRRFSVSSATWRPSKVAHRLIIRQLSSSSAHPPSSFAFLPPAELESWLETVENGQDRVLGRDFMVVDVRDPDQFELYHVKGAINLPSTVLLNLDDPRDAVELVRLEAFRVLNKLADVPLDVATNGRTEQSNPGPAEWPIPLPRNLVFHCNLSLIRGPKSAQRFLDGLAELHQRDRENPEKVLPEDFEIKVWVLEGGSKGWKGRNSPYTFTTK